MAHPVRLPSTCRFRYRSVLSDRRHSGPGLTGVGGRRGSGRRHPYEHQAIHKFYELVNCLMLVRMSSSGAAAAAETPVRPGPKMPPITEHRTITKTASRRGRTGRAIDTSHFQYSEVSARVRLVVLAHCPHSGQALLTERLDPEAAAASAFIGLRGEPSRRRT